MKKVEHWAQEVEESPRESYTKGEVLHILEHLGWAARSIEIDGLQRGDVFWFKLVGGKPRPWVVLSVRGGVVCAVSMSSTNHMPHAIKSQSRFWPGWIGTTVSLFHENEARKNVLHPYANRDHLREVEAKVAVLMGLRSLPGISSDADPEPEAPETRQQKRARMRAVKPSRVPANVEALRRVK